MSVSSPSCLSPAKQLKFQDLMDRGKELVKDGKVREGMEVMKEALTICRTSKLLSRIKKCEEYLENCEEDEQAVAEANENMMEVSKGFYLFNEIYHKLYPYQRDGISWMWKLYNRNKGGILGDDMGLGKTIQIIGFLSGMFQANLVKHVLIIMPVSLLPNWKQEFNKWCPDLLLYVFHGGSKKERERNLYRVQRRGGVLLTSYGLIVSNEESFTSFNERTFVWDYIILDEGHKIKNPTKTTKAVHNLASKNRLVLTGTPIQNNLEELWALYDFAHQGTLLGSRQTFKMQYENPITHARAKNATIGERKLGTEIAHNLRKLIEPYFLRRTKEEVLKNSENKENINCEEMDDLAEKMGSMKLSKLSRKNDLIIWTFLSDIQYKIYTGFLESETVKNILMTNKSPLVQLTVLKKICDHPRLLSNKLGFNSLLNGDACEDDVDKQLEEEEEAPTVSIENVSDEDLISESGKMGVLIQLLTNLKSEGHRTLVFSLSRKILDIIHKILLNRYWKVLRIDGTITKIEERAKRVHLFQTDASYPILLLTTQVGGVGLTLTAADRVVIYDPSWNPSTDAQAVDRVYRIGQSKNVVVYRFITCGTVEEKIYRRQVFKDSIIRQATGDTKDPYRYFTHQELYELFTVDNVRYSTTQVQLAEMHSNQRKTDTSLDEHIAYLHSLDIFGISDQDLMFTRNVKDEAEDNDQNVVCEDYIKKRVELAQKLVQTEANIAHEDLIKAGTYSRPYVHTIPTFRRPSEKDNYKPPKFPENVYPPVKEDGSSSTFGPFGDQRKELYKLSTEDEQSISALSPIKAKASPFGQPDHDKYKPPVINLSPLKKVNNKFEYNEDNGKEPEILFDIEDEDVVQNILSSTIAEQSISHTGSPDSHHALFPGEVVDIFTPGPFATQAGKKHSVKGGNSFSSVRSPCISDFRSMRMEQQNSSDELRRVSVVPADVNAKRVLFFHGTKSNEKGNVFGDSNNSAEVMAPNSESEEEFMTPAARNKGNSIVTQHHLHSHNTPVSMKSLHAASPDSVLVVDESLTSGDNSIRCQPNGACNSSSGKTPQSEELKRKSSQSHPPMYNSLNEHVLNNIHPKSGLDQCHPKSTSMHDTETSDVRSISDLTDSKPAVPKLWRFMQMHDALVKSQTPNLDIPSSEKLSSSEKVIGGLKSERASPPSKEGNLSPAFFKPKKNGNFSSSRNSFLKIHGNTIVVEVPKDATDVDISAFSSDYKIKSCEKRTPGSKAAKSDNNSLISPHQWASSRRITPLKLPAKVGTPIKSNSFTQAVAHSPEISNYSFSDHHQSKTPVAKFDQNKSPATMLQEDASSDSNAQNEIHDSPVVAGKNKSSALQEDASSDSDAHNGAHDSPVFAVKNKSSALQEDASSDSDAHNCSYDSPVVAVKKYHRRVIHSDSDSSASGVESGDDSATEDETDAEGSTGSLKDFIASESDVDEEQDSSVYEEESDYSESYAEQMSDDNQDANKGEQVKCRKGQNRKTVSREIREYSESSGSQTDSE